MKRSLMKNWVINTTIIIIIITIFGLRFVSLFATVAFRICTFQVVLKCCVVILSFFYFFSFAHLLFLILALRACMHSQACLPKFLKSNFFCSLSLSFFSSFFLVLLCQLSNNNKKHGIAYGYSRSNLF